mgnify:CR=1 FL=1
MFSIAYSVKKLAVIQQRSMNLPFAAAELGYNLVPYYMAEVGDYMMVHKVAVDHDTVFYGDVHRQQQNQEHLERMLPLKYLGTYSFFQKEIDIQETN